MTPKILLLICVLGGIAVVEYLLVRAARRSPTPQGKIAFVILAAIPLVIWLVVFSPFVKSGPYPGHSGCTQNLKVIQGAKETWARESHRTDRDIPLDADLFGPGKYLREKPKCPEGGVYRLGPVAENPTCSLGGALHSLVHDVPGR